MKKRLMALFLVLAMLTPALVACGSGDVDTSGKTDETTGGTAETTTGMFEADSIPDDIDYGGETINILCWEDATMPEFHIESATGENIVEDALYYRNQTVESRLGVELNFISQPGKDGNRSSWVAKVEQAATGNTGEFDILAGFSVAIGDCALGGFTYDLLEFDVLDFNAPWWSKDLIESGTINGRLYYASGDISTNLLYMMTLVFFNTTMIADLGLESPYDLVQNDEWFITKMFEMSDGLYEDLNNNFTKDVNDKFGTIMYQNNIDSLYFGCGYKAVDLVDGIPQFTDAYWGSETRDYIVMMIENLENDKDCYSHSSATPPREAFGKNNALFMPESPFVVPNVLDDYVDCQYGIVPLPKLNEYQEEYRTGMRQQYTFYTLFAGSPDPTRAATVMECMASEGYRQVTPAVFETTMKYQYALDDVAARMFDIVRDNIVYDVSHAFSGAFAQNPILTVRQRIQAKDADWVTFITRTSRIFEASLERIVTTLEEKYGE